eukprot:m.565929 g.565929  ORF g.565929 m.565929 type:complete len:572 (-) comp22246_c0_seq2:329-2044(-)
MEQPQSGLKRGEAARAQPKNDSVANMYSEDPVVLSAIAGSGTVISGQKSTIQALVTITTPPHLCEDEDRPAMHVACVLDKSGSMSGSRLAYAKRAVRKLVKHLSPGADVLHFIEYDSEASILFENGDLSDEGKSELISRIDAIRAGDLTNLCAGLQLGVEALQKSAESARMKPDVKRVFLFSDGMVNRGITNPAEIFSVVDGYVKEGITISTFGIGEDFDEALMTGIARRGKGSYTFLDTAENIPKLVSKSIHSLLALAGSEACLEVQGLNGAVVTKIYGTAGDDMLPDEFRSENEDLQTPDGIAQQHAPVGCRTMLGDLHMDNIKQVLVELNFTPSSAVPVPSIPVLQYRLVYKNAIARASAIAHVVAGKTDLTQKTLTGTLALAVTLDPTHTSTMNADVAVAHAIHTAATEDHTVLELLEAGKQGDAIEMKKASIDQMALLLRTLALQPEHRDGCCRRLARVVDRARDTLESMRLRSANAASMGVRYEMQVNCALSACGWESGCDSDSAHSDCMDDFGWESPPPYDALAPTTPNWDFSNTGLRATSNMSVASGDYDDSDDSDDSGDSSD